MVRVGVVELWGVSVYRVLFVVLKSLNFVLRVVEN